MFRRFRRPIGTISFHETMCPRLQSRHAWERHISSEADSTSRRGRLSIPVRKPSAWVRGFGPNPTGEKAWRKSIDLLHHYHRLVYEHRGLLSNLGYGHSGSYDAIYAPATEGRGRDKNLVGWELYDAHLGPLLDGSAFATAAPGCPGPRRAAKPIWGGYAPLNPEYPASYL